MPSYRLTGHGTGGCFSGVVGLSVYSYSTPRHVLCLELGAELHVYLSPGEGYWQPPVVRGSAVRAGPIDRIDSGGLLTINAVATGRATITSEITESANSNVGTGGAAPGGGVEVWSLRLRVVEL